MVALDQKAWLLAKWIQGMTPLLRMIVVLYTDGLEEYKEGSEKRQRHKKKSELLESTDKT